MAEIRCVAAHHAVADARRPAWSRKDLETVGREEQTEETWCRVEGDSGFSAVPVAVLLRVEESAGFVAGVEPSNSSQSFV